MICIIDYNLGNVISIKNAVNKIGYDCIISSKISDIESSKILILPGVGSFQKGMENLKKNELIGILNEQVIEKKKTILGICLGFQLMCETSDEFGESKGLGWIDLTVKKIKHKNFRLPHVGWNKVELSKPNDLFNNINNNDLFYYNHSFCIKNSGDSDFKTIAKCNYNEEFVSVGFKKNIYGIQPHPEKSQRQGLAFLDNFIKSKC